MRKIILTLLIVVLATSTLCLFACDKQKQAKGVNPVVIKVSANDYQITEETTLYDYMLMLKNDNKLNFTAINSDNGMFITSVNGTENGLGYNPCWMIYTDDDNFKDASGWTGPITVNGKSYAVASVGASSLYVTDGCEYVLYYASF